MPAWTLPLTIETFLCSVLPVAGSSRVPHVTEAAVKETDFDGFYVAHFGDTVAMTYGLTADIDEARDIAQEAFCRAWKRWPHLSAYENPIMWVRRVATNLAYSRWRHLRVAATHLLQHRTDDAVMAPPNPDHVTVVAGLRKLPRGQRTALVLHHMLDLPVTQVAELLDIPVGRAKMWLHRGRQSLAAELSEDFKSTASATIPPAGQVIQRAKDRHRQHKAITKAAAFLLAMLATAATSAVQLLWPVPPAQPSCKVDTDTRIRIATGHHYSIDFALGNAYAEQISKATGGKVTATVADTFSPVENVQTSTSTGNIKQLVAGEYQVAFSLADTAADAVLGKGEFDTPQPVQALARIYSDPVYVLARTGSGINTLADMKGKRVAIVSPNSLTELIADRLLRSAGLDPDKDLSVQRLDLDTTISEMSRHGYSIDASFFIANGGQPTRISTGLSISLDDWAKPIDISALLSEMNKINPAYDDGIISAGTFYAGTPYTLKADVKTITVPHLLLVKNDIDPNLACALTKAFYDRQPGLANVIDVAPGVTLDTATKTTTVMLNPGAKKALDALNAQK